MMNTPWLRAFCTTACMRDAISATRRVAPWHQCLSHMSQMTMAVFFGLHSTVFSTRCHSLLPSAVFMRLRVARSRGWEESVAKLARPVANSTAAVIQETRQGKAFIGLVDRADANGRDVFVQPSGRRDGGEGPRTKE